MPRQFGESTRGNLAHEYEPGSTDSRESAQMLTERPRVRHSAGGSPTV